MKDNHGLTLMELLVTLSLLAVISVVGISFFFIPNKAYDRIVVRNNLEDDVNSVLRRIADDIHSAIKPDYHTNAVEIYNSQGNISTSGNMMYIYGYYNKKYQKISYKYENGALYMGTIERDDAESIIKANVNANEYSEILRGVIGPDEAGDLFQDITVDPLKNDQRTISVNIIARDAEKNIVTSREKPLILTTRTKNSP